VLQTLAAGGAPAQRLALFARPVSGWTLLHQAAYWGNWPAAEALVKAGADRSACTRNGGQTAAAVATERGHAQLAAFLAAPPQQQPPQQRQHQRVICVGDLHGNVTELRRLFESLEARLGASSLADASVVFLGDYCDRGPCTREVFDWLIDFRDRRRAGGGQGRTCFLAGNHDMGMAAYLGCLPTAESASFFEHLGQVWGRSDNYYEAASCFASYGCTFGGQNPAKERASFVAAVPKAHKRFLRDLDWVVDWAVPWQPGRLVCVHAGLHRSRSCEEQIEALKARDFTATVLHDPKKKNRLVPLQSREDVEDAPSSLHAVLVSGHHGKRVISGNRIIMDLGGGRPTAQEPLQAIILPEHTIVGSDDPVEAGAFAAAPFAAAPQQQPVPYEALYEEVKANGQWAHVLQTLAAGGAPAQRLALFARPVSGWTLLHQAAYWGNWPAAEALVKAGADRSACTRNGGQTAAAVATERGHAQLAAFLAAPQQQPAPLPQAQPPGGETFSVIDLDGVPSQFVRATDDAGEFAQRGPIFFCAAARVAVRQRRRQPVMLMARRAWTYIENANVTHPGAFGSDHEQLTGGGVALPAGTGWWASNGAVAVWKFPGDLNGLVGFRRQALQRQPLPVGEYPLHDDCWAGNLPANFSLAAFPVGSACEKIRVDFPYPPCVHYLEAGGTRVAMIGSSYFVKEMWQATDAEREWVSRLLHELNAVGLRAFVCYSQHHAIVFYAMGSGATSVLCTPERLAQQLGVLDGNGDGNLILQILKRNARSTHREKLSQWARAYRSWFLQ